LNTLLSCVNQNLIMLLFDLYHVLRRWVQQQSHKGIYEILVRRVTARRIDATSICG